MMTNFQCAMIHQVIWTVGGVEGLGGVIAVGDFTEVICPSRNGNNVRLARSSVYSVVRTTFEITFTR